VLYDIHLELQKLQSATNVIYCLLYRDCYISYSLYR